jgi:hypothetical protein
MRVVAATLSASQPNRPLPVERNGKRSAKSHPFPSNMAPGNYTLTAATTITEVEALRPIWKKWMLSPESDIDYYLHRLSLDKAVLRPHILTVWSGGVARAMLIGRIRGCKTATVVSFVTIPGPAARVLEIKHGGRIGQPSAEIDKLLARELLDTARSGQIDSICFERLPLQASLYREIKYIARFFVKERVPHTFCYSVLKLHDKDKLGRIFKGKIGREIRRKERILDREFHNQVSLKCFSEPEELDVGLSDTMRIAVTTWQYYLGTGLINDGGIRETFQFLAKHGWLRIFVLYVADMPSAFLVGQLYNDSFYCQYAGYDPKYTRFSVGSLLSARSFNHLAAIGVQRIDLGEGGQEHNRRWGCETLEEGTVHVYSPTFRGICLNLFVGTAQIVRNGGRRTQSALKLRWVQKLWSHFLLSRWKSRTFLSSHAYGRVMRDNVQTKH